MNYSRWSPGAVWFLGTGLGLLLLGAINWTHVGMEPCERPTAPIIRWANVVFLLFGFGAVAAVDEPQAWVVVGCFHAANFLSQARQIDVDTSK